MASILAKQLGWSYSRTSEVMSKTFPRGLLLSTEQLKACLGTQSQFMNKQQKARTQRNKKRYLNRIHALEPGYDAEMSVNEYIKDNANPISRVYVWGLACYGALGNPDLIVPKKTLKKISETMHKPIRCSFVEMLKVKDIACGYGFTIFAANDGKKHLYGTGLNKDGQIPHNPIEKGKLFDVIIQPVPVSLPTNSKVVRVSAGRAHTMALTEKGEVFSMGNNSYGQCGRNIIDDEDYQRSSIIHKVQINDNEMDDEIVDVTCGMDHSIFRSSKGHLYSCGWGADGQTGQGHYNNESNPTRLMGDISNEFITKVSCAADCVLALNDKGDVFGWGNSEYGQFQTVTDEQQLSTPTKLNISEITGKVIDIASGGTVCMVLNENRDVFVWGYGILGKGADLEHTVHPTLIPSTLFGRNEFNPDIVTNSIFCGLSTNAALNSNGELFTWGKNRSSCLGLGDWRNQYFPLRVNCGAEITKISLGVDHSCALAKPWI